MRRLRVLALMHEGMVPPEDVSSYDLVKVDWKMEYDVISTLEEIGHDVLRLGVSSDLGAIRKAMHDFTPHIVFNLLEDFDDVAIYDQNVVSYLELIHMPYTGCNPRGLMLARDKALSKQLLTYHRISVPDFAVFRRGKPIKKPKKLHFPLIVKSLILEGSAGISQASVVEDEDHLSERVEFIHDHFQTDAIVERYIEGRELYVGVIGNHRLQVFPVWELYFKKRVGEVRPIATGRVKWNSRYQKRYGITTAEAKHLPEGKREAIQHLCKRVYRILGLSGYARLDLRLDPNGRIYVLEANPNPQIAYGEDFAESAEHAGISYEALMQRIISLGRRWESERYR
jgi:D-alanine-D-alanine ligase